MAKNLQKYEVKKAIKGSGGIISKIARSLGVEWHTAKKYIEEHNLNEELNNEQETMLDVAETMLFENIKEQDNTAIIFFLKTKGRHRGYIEKQIIDNTSSDGTMSPKEAVSYHNVSSDTLKKFREEANGDKS